MQEPDRPQYDRCVSRAIAHKYYWAAFVSLLLCLQSENMDEHLKKCLYLHFLIFLLNGVT